MNLINSFTSILTPPVQTITLNTATDDGNTVKIDTLTIKKGSILVQKIPTDEGQLVYNLEEMVALHKNLKHVLDTGQNLITIPDNIKFEVIDVK